MSLNLLNLQSNQLFKLDNDNPLIIGRGNVEGCFDKRVSRSHGRITCTVDKKIRLEALHSNPCFFTRNGVPPIHQLNKNEEETLNEGDYLGLLPNAFWFKVTSDKETGVKKEEELNKLKTEISYVENDRTNTLESNGSVSDSQIKEAVILEDDQCTSSDIQNELHSFSIPASSSDLGSVGSSKIVATCSEISTVNSFMEFEKTRRLPLWMYEVDEPVESNKSPKKHSIPNTDRSHSKKQKTLSDIELKKEPAEEDRKMNTDEITMINCPSTSKIENTCEGTHTNSECDLKLENSQTEGKSSEKSKRKEGYESDVSNERDTPARPICQYEGNCYRKNPLHKLEYCHPGDSDYVPYEERPLCQFGAACYRRNEKHKVEFRHPAQSSCNVSSESSSSHGSRASSPLPVKRRRKKVKRGNSDYGDYDEYDLEDPFINDASSDEYVPSDLDSEQEEDLDSSREVG